MELKTLTTTYIFTYFESSICHVMVWTKCQRKDLSINKEPMTNLINVLDNISSYILFYILEAKYCEIVTVQLSKLKLKNNIILHT